MLLTLDGIKTNMTKNTTIKLIGTQQSYTVIKGWFSKGLLIIVNSLFLTMYVVLHQTYVSTPCLYFNSRAKLRVPFFTVMLQFLKCLSHSQQTKEEDTPYQIRTLLQLSRK